MFLWVVNQYIRMISERSCDTEDWRNDAENSDLITKINYIFENNRKKTSNRKQLFEIVTIFHNITAFTYIFEQIIF